MKQEHFYTVAVTHKKFSLKDVGLLHLDDSLVKEQLQQLKATLGLKELIYLSTCNRVEFLFTTEHSISKSFLQKLFYHASPALKATQLKKLVSGAQLFSATGAVEHVLRLASSLESLVVGEREIITQFRHAYDKCRSFGLTGDFMRLLSKHTIETAKQVFTETDIAKNPVSVVSMAYRLLKAKHVKGNARCLFVGAGQTNSTMAKYLKKHHFSSFTVFNRSLSKAKELAAELNGEAYELNKLAEYKKGFDILVSCTGSTAGLISSSVYKQLLQGEADKKIIIDLAVPNDVQADVLKKFNIDYISVSELKKQAKENVALRKKEIKACEAIIEARTAEFNSIIKERVIELAFGEIPQKIKEINQLALNEVFAKDVKTLDEDSRQTIEKIITYIEKKYNAVAITTAKRVFLDK